MGPKRYRLLENRGHGPERGARLDECPLESDKEREGHEKEGAPKMRGGGKAGCPTK